MTLIELMVAVALVSVVIVVVANIFSTASTTAGRTVGHTELLDTAATIERTVRSDVSSIAPGFLVLYSPNVEQGVVPGGVPTDLQLPPRNDLTDVPDVLPARPSDRGIGTGGNPTRSTRADMLVFGTSTVGNQSWWLTTRSLPLSRPTALVTYGHGVVAASPTPQPPLLAGRLPTTDAVSWNLCRRAVLLGAPDPGVAGLYDTYLALTRAPRRFDNTVSTATSALDLRNFDAFIPQGRLDATVTPMADLVQALRRHVLANTNTSTGVVNWTSLTGTSSAVSISGVLRRTDVLPNVTDPQPSNPDPNYYRQQCFRFMPRVGSVTVEWTDGSLVDPRYALDTSGVQAGRFVALNPALQWFGQPRDGNFDGDMPTGASNARMGRAIGAPGANADLNDPEDVMTQEQWAFRWGPLVNPPAGSGLQNVVQTHRVDGVDANGNYFAVWTVDTWQYRPKALRFIVRLYDQNHRIVNEEPWPPRLPSAPPTPVVQYQQVTEKRYGLEFTLVIPLP